MSEVKTKARAAREASYSMASLSTETKNQALTLIADAIWDQRNGITNANRKDIEEAQVMLENGEINEAMMNRLRLDESKILKIVDMIKSVAALEDPIGITDYSMELDQGLELNRTSSPLGVIGVIFESRPDALTQISSLCLKSGNSVILKGGSEAKHSNKKLYTIIKDSSEALPKGWIQLLESRKDVKELLDQDEYVDLIIPRGSNSFVRYIQENTRIPVLGHSDGVCHIYIDWDADVEMAVDVCYDAKVQYPSVCNAVDMILVHSDIATMFLPQMIEKFQKRNVEIHGFYRVRRVVSDGVIEATVDDLGREYLDYIVSLKIVDDLDEAVSYINRYGSHHTDAIITSSQGAAHRFMNSVDSANVFWNASTRFSDGYRYGLGAEVGISTGKIHARGPTGLEGLTSYKYHLKGNGHVVADYSGKNAKKFTHKLIQ